MRNCLDSTQLTEKFYQLQRLLSEIQDFYTPLTENDEFRTKLKDHITVKNHMLNYASHELKRIKMSCSYYDEYCEKLNALNNEFLDKLEADKSTSTEEAQQIKVEIQKLNDSMQNIVRETNKFTEEVFDSSTSNEVSIKNPLESSHRTRFIFHQDKIHSIDNDLIRMYPSSLFYVLSTNYKSEKRNGCYVIDNNDQCFEDVLAYMQKKDVHYDSFEDEAKVRLLEDLCFYSLPIRPCIFDLCLDADKKLGYAWNNRMIFVNGVLDFILNDYLREEGFINFWFEIATVHDILYSEEYRVFYMNKVIHYVDLLDDYITKRKLNIKLLFENNYFLPSVINEFQSFNISINPYKVLRSTSFQLFFATISKIIKSSYYDYALQYWTGHNMNWSLIYRASEHGDKTEAFHRCCDNKGQTLILIKAKSKASKICIFGGYTSMSWTSNSILSITHPHGIDTYVKDPKAFLFSLKNNSMDYIKQYPVEDAAHAFFCSPESGPIFGGNTYELGDLYIANECLSNSNSSCCLGISYEKSMLENSSVLLSNKEENFFREYFKVLEVEVFGIMSPQLSFSNICLPSFDYSV